MTHVTEQIYTYRYSVCGRGYVGVEVQPNADRQDMPLVLASHQQLQQITGT